MARLNADDVANYLILKSNIENIPISNLKLQKLMYYCQAWYLALNHKRLFDEDIEAWVHGAVVKPIYNKFSGYGYNNICVGNTALKEKITYLEQKFDGDLVDFFGKIISEYFVYSAEEIRELNHKELPWKKARKGYAENEPSNEIISDKWMEKYYGIRAVEKGWKTVTNDVYKFSLKDLVKANKKIETKEVFKPNEGNVEKFCDYVIGSYEITKQTTWRAMNGSKL